MVDRRTIERDGPFDATDRKLVRETNDRVRRMETRLTNYLEQQGYDTGVKRCVFRGQAPTGQLLMDIPSPATSLKDVVAAIPPWARDGQQVQVFCGDETIATIIPPERPS